MCYIDGGVDNSGYENLSIQFFVRLYLEQGFVEVFVKENTLEFVDFRN